MNCAPITNESQSITARLYRVMKKARRWMSTLELQEAVTTTCISTQLSAIRKQLPSNEHIEKDQRGTRFYYRLVTETPVKIHPGQLEMFPKPPPHRVASYDTGIDSAARNRHRQATKDT